MSLLDKNVQIEYNSSKYYKDYKMKKIAIQLVHPNYEESRVNKALIQAVENLENVTVHRLYEKYPNHKIDVEAEQKILLENDVVLFQFPLYWLSSPSLLKEWFDATLTYNFAFGEQYLLEGKKFAIATSAGSGTKEYSETGSNKLTVEEFLNPFIGTANYTKMSYQNPFITYETFVLSDEQLEVASRSYVKYIQELAS